MVQQLSPETYTNASKYKKLLNDTFDTIQQLLEELVAIKKNNILPSPERLDTLQQLHKEVIVGTIPLVIAKDQLKADYHKYNDSVIDKVRLNYNQYTNPKILKLKSLNQKNLKLIAEFNRAFASIPELNLNLIMGEDESNIAIKKESSTTETEDTTDSEFLKSLNKDKIEIKQNFDKSNLQQSQITDDQVTKFESILKKDDLRKFKLVQLHDRYYERELNQLQQMQLKWDSRLNSLTKFIKEDSVKVKDSIKQIQIELDNEREKHKQDEIIEEEEEEEDDVEDQNQYFEETHEFVEGEEYDRMDGEEVIDEAALAPTNEADEDHMEEDEEGNEAVVETPTYGGGRNTSVGVENGQSDREQTGSPAPGLEIEETPKVGESAEIEATVEEANNNEEDYMDLEE